MSIVVLTIILVIGTIGILTDTDIIAHDISWMKLYNEHVTTDRKQILIRYLPIYNIYLRYQEHNFDTPDILIKESILTWLLFVIFGFCTTPFWTSIWLIVIIIRVASLMGGIDIINPEIKKFINTLFSKNPEELR
jgi:hypothetical protein